MSNNINVKQIEVKKIDVSEIYATARENVKKAERENPTPQYEEEFDAVEYGAEYAANIQMIQSTIQAGFAKMGGLFTDNIGGNGGEGDGKTLPELEADLKTALGEYSSIDEAKIKYNEVFETYGNGGDEGTQGKRKTQESLSIEANNLAKELEPLQQDINKLTEQNNQKITPEIKEQTAIISECDTNISGYQVAIEELENQLTGDTKNDENIKRAINEYQDKIEAEENKKQDAESKIKELDKEFYDTMKEIEEKQNELKEKKATVEQKRSEAEKLTGEINTEMNALKDQFTALEGIISKAEGIQAQIDQLKGKKPETKEAPKTEAPKTEATKEKPADNTNVDKGSGPHTKDEILKNPVNPDANHDWTRTGIHNHEDEVKVGDIVANKKITEVNRTTDPKTGEKILEIKTEDGSSSGHWYGTPTTPSANPSNFFQGNDEGYELSDFLKREPEET